MKLTNLEYSVLMQAIQNANTEHQTDDFIDVYERANAEPEPTYQDITDALKTAEAKLHAHHIIK